MRSCPRVARMSEITGLVAIPGSADSLAAVIDGRAMISLDEGRTWRNAGFDGAGASIDTIATDATRPQRIWAAAGGRIVVSDDLGSSWHSIRRSLPEASARVRGIAASADATSPGDLLRPRNLLEARTAVKRGLRKKTIFRSISRPGLSPEIRIA